jgi:DHA2 family multidrug resistance protein
MFRNIAGSIGISLSSALLTTRGQVRMSHLGDHQTPFSQPYSDALAAVTRTIQGSGVPHAAALQSAAGHFYRQLINQSQILAYCDVFEVCAILAFCTVPLAFFLAPIRAGSAGPGAH